MSRGKLTAEERIELAKEYLRGETSYKRIARKNGISTTTVEEIVSIYESQGEEVRTPLSQNASTAENEQSFRPN